MSFIEKNLELIKHRDIVLYDQLQLQLAKPIDRVMSEDAKDGNTYLRVLHQGKWVAFNSTYKPMDEAEKFAAKYKNLPLFGRVLFLGLGNGFVARALRNQFNGSESLGDDVVNAERKFAFYEPDASIFLYVMQTYDLTDILSDENISIFVEGLNANLVQNWCNENVHQLNASIFYYDALPKYKEYYEDAYSRLYNICNDTKLQVQAYAETKKVLASRIAENNMRNLPYFLEAHNVFEFIKAYPKNLPYVLVAAGPSLKQSIEFLKDIQDSVFIMVVDTAAKYVLEQGVTPDAIMCIDPQKALLLFDESLKEIPFFVHADVNHCVLEQVNPRLIYFAGTNLKYYEMLGAQIGIQLLDLDFGGSVATAAFSLGTLLDTNCIILVGQDLAFTKTASHAISSINRTSSDEKCIRVPGNDIEWVNTYEDFYVYLKWFEQAIMGCADKKVFNVSAGGARIEGATYVSLDEAKHIIETAESVEKKSSFFEYQTAMHQHKFDKKDICLSIMTQMETVKILLDEAMAVADAMIRNMPVDGYEQFMMQGNWTLDKVAESLNEIPEFELLENYVSAVADGLLDNLYQEQEDKRQELLGIYQKLNCYYKTLCDQLPDFLELCKDALS